MINDGWVVSWPVHGGVTRQGQPVEIVIGLVSENGRLDVGIHVGQEGETVLLPRTVEKEQDIAIDLSATLRKAIAARMKVDGEL